MVLGPLPDVHQPLLGKHCGSFNEFGRNNHMFFLFLFFSFLFFWGGTSPHFLGRLPPSPLFIFLGGPQIYTFNPLATACLRSRGAQALAATGSPLPPPKKKNTKTYKKHKSNKAKTTNMGWGVGIGRGAPRNCELGFVSAPRHLAGMHLPLASAAIFFPAGARCGINRQDPYK